MRISRETASATSAWSILDAEPERSPSRPILTALGSLCAHALIAASPLLIVRTPTEHIPAVVRAVRMVDVELSPTPAPIPLPAQAESSLDRAPAPPKPPPSAHRRSTTEEEPPRAAEAAQAGQVLASDDVVDLSEAFVVGSGTSYAGGTTATRGTAKHAVHDPRAQADGAPRTTAAAVAASAIDRSRSPQLAGAGQWDCPFPSEADLEGIDNAVVTLRVEIGTRGEVRGARLIHDPGNGFGREARRCAMSKRWTPGLDRSGSPAAATTLVNVNFRRQ